MKKLLTYILPLLMITAVSGCGRKDVPTLLGHAAAALEKGKPETAQTLTEKAIHADPENADALLLHALTREAQEDLTSAINAATKAAGLRPDSFAAQYTRGRLCAAAGNNPDALYALGKALELRPKDRNTLILLANVNMRVNPLNAMRYLAMFPRDDSLRRSAAYRNQIGIGMILNGSLKKGAENLRDAQRVEPKNPIYLLNMARFCDYYAKRTDIAVQYYQQYLKLAPAPGNSLYKTTEARLQRITGR